MFYQIKLHKTTYWQTQKRRLFKLTNSQDIEVMGISFVAPWVVLLNAQQKSMLNMKEFGWLLDYVSNRL